MSEGTVVAGLEFDPQLGTAATAMSVNYFVRAADPDNSDVELTLRPPFQRNLVWNEAQKAFLIDSILRGFPVPELYVQVNVSEEGSEQIVIVDGQQRISACLAFVNGEFSLGDSDEFDPRWRAKAFSELSVSLKSRFRSYEFIARKLPAKANDQALREIFRRLNRTVEVLQPQELRHAAYTGAFIEFVESAASAVFLRDLGVFTPADYRRRRNDEFVAEVLMAVQAKAFPNKKDGLDELFLTFERQGFPEKVGDNLKRRFGRVASFMDTIAPDLKKTRFRNKSDAYSLLVFLSWNAEFLKLDNAQGNLFVDVAAEFSDAVNSIKRLESSQEPTESLTESDAGKNALGYLRAVERAASDRLSRVRRAEVLEKTFGAVFAEVAPIALSESDATWLVAVDDELDVDEEDSHQATLETLAVQESLLQFDG